MHKERGTSGGSKPVHIGDLHMGLISRLQRPGPCHLQPWNRIHVPFFPFTRISTEHETSFHVRISPRRRRPDGTDKSSPRTILTGLYELPAGQLGTTPSSSRIRIQQCHKGYHPRLSTNLLAPSSSSEA